MSTHFDELLAMSAEDGASTPVGVLTPHTGAETDHLMQAWYDERQASIENSFFLDQARQLLMRILNDGEVTAAHRQKTRRLLRALKATRHERRTGGF